MILLKGSNLFVFPLFLEINRNCTTLYWEIYYVSPLSPNSPVPDYVKSTVETVMKIHNSEGDGDILAFLTGQVDAK